MAKLLLVLFAAVGVLAQQPPGRVYLPSNQRTAEASNSRLSEPEVSSGQGEQYSSPLTNGAEQFGDPSDGPRQKQGESSRYRAPSGDTEVLNDLTSSQYGAPSGNFQTDGSQFAQYNSQSRSSDVGYPARQRDGEESSFGESRYPSFAGGANTPSSAHGPLHSGRGTLESSGVEDFSASSSRFTNVNNREQLDEKNKPSSRYNAPSGNARYDSSARIQGSPSGGRSSNLNGPSSSYESPIGDRSSALKAPSNSYGAPIGERSSALNAPSNSYGAPIGDRSFALNPPSNSHKSSALNSPSNSYGAPSRDRSSALNAPTNSYGAPIGDGSSDLNAPSNAYEAPSRDRSSALNAPSKEFRAPDGDQSSTLNAPSNSYRSPIGDRSSGLNAPSNSYRVPNRDRSSALNVPSNAYGAPSGDRTSDLNAPSNPYRSPTGHRSSALNSPSNAYGAPDGDRSSGLNAPSSSYGVPDRNSPSQKYSSNDSVNNSPSSGAIKDKSISRLYDVPNRPDNRENTRLPSYNQVGGGNSYQKGGANDGNSQQSGNVPSSSYGNRSSQPGDGSNNLPLAPGYPSSNSQVRSRSSSNEDLEEPSTQSETSFGIQIDDPSTQSVSQPSSQNGENTPPKPSTRQGSQESELSDDLNAEAYQYRTPHSGAFVENSGRRSSNRFEGDNSQNSALNNDPFYQEGGSALSNQGGNFKPQINDPSTFGRDNARSEEFSSLPGSASAPFPDGGARIRSGGSDSAPFPDGGARSSAAEAPRSSAIIDPLFKPADYEFSYQVSEPFFGNDYAHHERRVEDFAQGEYYVLLPDGRVQVVEYEADQGGYRPMIRYEGLRGIRGKFSRLSKRPSLG